MTYTVVLEKNRNGYTATVPVLPGVTVLSETRETALAAATAAIRQRLTTMEVVEVEVDVSPDGLVGYGPAQVALAQAAARQRGEPDAPLTGRPWLDFAGYLAYLPDEDWAAYEAELVKAREEGNGFEEEIGLPTVLPRCAPDAGSGAKPTCGSPPSR